MDAAVQPAVPRCQIDDMPMDAYLTADGSSNSTIKKFALLTPAEAIWELRHQKETQAMAMGTVTHSAILEPDGLERRVMVVPRPEGGFRSKVAKEFRADKEAEAAASKRQLVWGNDMDAVFRMRDAVHSHPSARAILAAGKPEVSLFATDPETGEPLRSREDWQPTDIGLIPDLKTTADPRAWAFRSQIVKLGYHIAAFHYSHVHELVHQRTRDYCWIAVGSNEPHLVAVYYADSELLAWGEHQWRQGLTRMLECRAAGVYPGLPDEPQQLGLPHWARQEAINAGVIEG